MGLQVIGEVVLKYAGQPLFYIWITHATYVTVKVTCVSLRASLNGLYGKSNIEKKEDHQSTVLFFPDKKQLCPSLVQENKKCQGIETCLYGHKETSLWKLINTLALSQYKLDVCVFVITSQDLADILIKKHKEGVIVRIVTDCEKMDLNCSQIEQMRANGIQVRHDKTSYFMHHKFALIDNEYLVNGSFNWTKQAITGNQENVIISTEKDLISPYRMQFEKLWDTYKPGAQH